MRDLARGLLQLLYPRVCAACACSLASEPAKFCPSCRALLQADPHPTCPRCAATVGPFANIEGRCPACRQFDYQFDRAVRLGAYEGLLRALVLRMKHSAGELTAEFLGEAWAEHRGAQVRELGVQLVIPVPLHWRRRWFRGYNQSEAIARGLARHLKLPCCPRWLRRVRPTEQQTRQTPAGRWQNVKGAFRSRPRSGLRGKTVLLVDDVLTTGSTCSEAAAALRSAGAARVIAGVLAHSQAP
jgi:ComF family protein